MSLESVEVVVRGYRAFIDGDFEAIAELLDDDVEWRRLDVLRTDAGGPFDDAGVVEFVAHHRSRSDRTARGRLHEVSRFVREGGRWLYVEGDVEP